MAQLSVNGQKRLILDYLQQGGTLTTYKGFQLGISMKIPTRIGELIRDGYPIIKTKQADGTIEYSMPRSKEDIDKMFEAR